MRPARVAAAFGAAVLLFTLASMGKPGHVAADAQGAVLSNALVFDCQPGPAVRAHFLWSGLNAGLQFLDLSLFDNGFAPDTFVSSGALPPYQSSFAWDGLYPGALHFVRVNTLTPSGWLTSQTMIFFTPNDCPVNPVVAVPYASLPYTSTPYASAPCASSSLGAPVTGINACVSTPRGDFGTYGIGETVYYCYSTGQPSNVRIVAFKPDGTQLVVLDGYDNGAGGCAGPFQANVPIGLRTVELLGGPYYQVLGQTHFYVR